jgi:flagellar hook-associated protein 2
MAGIQISGLLSNSAFDWKSVVDQLIQADSAPVTALTAQKTTNTSQITALAGLQTSLTDLQDSIQAIRANDLFNLRNVTSDTTGTTWNSNSASGATVGSYAFDVQQLATAARIQGASDIGQGLAATSTVTGVTLATLNTATAVNAGTLTVNGQQVTLALTDSLQDVFNKISLATGGDVTGSYDPASDGITLASGSGEVVLGAANDTSNFFQVMKLANNGTPTTSSSAALGTLKPFAPLAGAGLKAAVTAVDPQGNGSFAINGVSISYNVNTDSLSAILGRINQSGAGVTASYDSAGDRVNIVNSTTGDTGIGLTDPTGGLLGALGLTGASGTLTHGKNALFTVNGGPVLSSASNTLDASTHGITGLSVTVNSRTTQTVTVASDTASMQTALQTFMDKFNAAQDAIDTNTKITVSGGTVTTSVLSSNREVQAWAGQLRSIAFGAISGLGGTVQRLDNLGIDFDSTTGHLTVKDSTKLASALTNHPDDVQAFFLTPGTGLVSKMFTYLTNVMGSDTTQQSNLTTASSDIDKQVATLQARLTDERTQLTNSFIQMLDAQSSAQNQSLTLTNAFFAKNSTNTTTN